jgi:glycosyltransferase involved in cell wall biosynthesis
MIKGPLTLLRAATLAAPRLDRPLRLTIAGRGSADGQLLKAVDAVRRRHPSIDVRIAGWLDEAGRADALADTDVVVVPSLWPEPFGLAGIEAGFAGVPAVGFAVGGIPEWLEDGVNGVLAPGDPPTASNLADALVRCLGDERLYRRVCDGARTVAARYRLGGHLDRLESVLAGAASGAPGVAVP